MRHVLAAKFLDALTKPARGGTVAVASAFLPPAANKTAIRVGERRPQSDNRGLLLRRRRSG
jgi:hypothetical protein